MKTTRYFVLATCLAYFFCCLTNANGQAPNWLWARQLGGSSYDNSFAMTVDASGNVYTAGYFQDTADFDPGPGVFNLAAAGQFDAFVSKLDASGNFVWAKRIGGSDIEEPHSLVLDPSGNIYLAGHFTGMCDFDPGPLTYNLNTTSIGTDDVFICKLDSAGNFIWAKSFGSIDIDGAYSIRIDAADNLYVTGRFHGTVDFDPGPGTYNLTSAGAADIFISKWNSNGNLIWAKSFGGLGSDEGHCIATDDSANVYDAGWFTQSVDFDPGPGVSTLTSAGQVDIYVTKFDSAGNFIWAKSLGGQFDDFVLGMDVDHFGNVYTTGSFNDTADFDPGPGVYQLSTTLTHDIYVSKADQNGNFVWAKSMGGPLDVDNGISIAVDHSGTGDVYTTGYFNGTADFDPGPGVYSQTAVAWEDIFVSKLSSSGNFIWEKSTGGRSFDQGNSIAIAPGGTGDIYVVGTVCGSAVSFDGDTLFDADSSGNKPNVFVAKLSKVINNLESYGSTHSISISSNPADNYFTLIFQEQKEEFELRITDIAGKEVFTATSNNSARFGVNTSGFSAGIYLLEVRTRDTNEFMKLVVRR